VVVYRIADQAWRCEFDIVRLSDLSGRPSQASHLTLFRIGTIRMDIPKVRTAARIIIFPVSSVDCQYGKTIEESLT
jgi:hypothetical protein